MSGKKQKQKDNFPDSLLRAWENADGVDFAVAPARLTGWSLHVDWWTPYDDALPEEMRFLRVYVGTDTDAIYDFKGRKG